MTRPRYSSSLHFYQVFAIPNFRLLWFGQLISSFGDRFTQTALLIFVFAASDEERGKLTAQFMFFGMLPGLVLAPLYGWLVDSFDRKRIMILMDMMRVFIVLFLAFVLRGKDLWLANALMFVLGACNGLFIPARQAALPQIIAPDRLVAANGMIALLGPIASLLGLPISYGIILLAGPFDGFIINAVGFILSAVCVNAITQSLSPDKDSHEHHALQRSWSELMGGWSTLKAHPALYPFIFIYGLFALASIMFLVMVLDHVKRNLDTTFLEQTLVPMLRSLLGEGKINPTVPKMIAVATLFGCIGVGMGLGVLVCGRTSKWTRWNGLPYLGLLLLGLGFCVFAGLTNLFVVAPFALVLGAVSTLLPVPIDARLQNDIDNQHRGRLFALRNFWSTTCSLLALGIHLDGRLIAQFGPSAIILTLGETMVAIALLLAYFNRNQLNSFWAVRLE